MIHIKYNKIYIHCFTFKCLLHEIIVQKKITTFFYAWQFFFSSKENPYFLLHHNTVCISVYIFTVISISHLLSLLFTPFRLQHIAIIAARFFEFSMHFNAFNKNKNLCIRKNAKKKIAACLMCLRNRKVNVTLYSRRSNTIL